MENKTLTNHENGNKIYFDNIQDAAQFVGGNRGNIHKCLKNKYNRVIAYGHKWEYTHVSTNLLSKVALPI
jgi:hypothetical protein